MTRFGKVSLAISAATLAIGGVAYAQMPQGDPMMDTDGDGTVTRSESQAMAAAMFARMDVNKDGKLDRTDREERRTEMKNRMFEMLDANKDGSISKQEFMDARHPGHDGMRGPGGPGMDDAGMDGMDGHHGKRGDKRGWHRGGMAMMKMADTDNDGAISQAEFEAAAARHFDMMDANKDGTVTKEERKAARDKMKAQWQAKKAQKTSAAN
ncbi:EF-hand domain-containing protein [Novosphingobium pentaromativorans]|uniref:EF-hand domain-containing protein n=1 Tax=Novosphingobium pentaromativorans US6-1 TaxID=1088721 RepID=G6ECA2_9SPHN|nr:EF-hand domain-containing protein [Novosphingobium pentaromativorans]AIT80116.1 hypothetical protein JI59_10205 [Novosphingobium pentaromativorans US6-1]EHJ61037.1 hypothetical protein NSU_1973 [Novosphingobium pentaromativorans US6-1]